MENSENITGSGIVNNQRRNMTLLVAAGIVAAFLIYYTVMSLIAPARKLNEIRAGFGTEQEGEMKPASGYFTDSAYVEMMTRKTFLQSRISMAGTDSVYITLNLADSTANLEISGVAVHTAKISSLKMSRILRRENDVVISSMLASPMTIVKDYATIRKEPLMVKMAPKDTSEFKPDVIPDTSDYEPVNYILEMDRGIRIFVYQETDTIAKDKNSLFFFDLRDRMKNVSASLGRTIRLKVPEYHPFIKIRVPKADAKVLYRAVPRNGQIAIYR